MARKRDPNDPRILAVQQPRLLTEQVDELIVHLLRCPDFFDFALARTNLWHWGERHFLIWKACSDLAAEGVRPRDQRFRRRFEQRVRRLLVEDPDRTAPETAEELIGQGGLIDRAFQLREAELSEDHARSLLKQFLLEQTVIDPLRDLLDHSDSVPKGVTYILETVVERSRSVEGIGGRAIKTLGEDWQEHSARLQRLRGRQLAGLRTGQAELDRRTRGLRGIIILGAKPGAGKTTYACVELTLGVCRHFADNDCVVVVVSLDMSRYDLYLRFHCHMADMEWATLVFGSPEEDRAAGSMFSDQHQAMLAEAQTRLQGDQLDLRVTVLDREVLGDDITAARLTEIVREQKAKANAKRAMLVIDYLQLLPVPDEVAKQGDLAADKYRVRMIQKVVENTRTAKDAMGDTVLLISEARKPPSAKDRWGESMSELMGSARLAYAADAVILYREMTVKEMQEYYGVVDKVHAEARRRALQDDGVVPAMLVLDKGRDGMLRGKWGVEFLYRKSIFREIRPGQALTDSLPPPRENRAADGGNGESSESAASGPVATVLPLPPLGPSGGCGPKRRKSTGKREAGQKVASAATVAKATAQETRKVKRHKRKPK